MDAAYQVLQTFAVPEGLYAEAAVKVAARGMDISSAQAWQKELAANAKTLLMQPLQNSLHLPTL